MHDSAPPTRRFDRASTPPRREPNPPNPTMARGKLIVFEGLDRAGKSTQCEKLVADLQNDGVKVRHMRFPGTCTP